MSLTFHQIVYRHFSILPLLSEKQEDKTELSKFNLQIGQV